MWSSSVLVARWIEGGTAVLKRLEVHKSPLFACGHSNVIDAAHGNAKEALHPEDANVVALLSRGQRPDATAHENAPCLAYPERPDEATAKDQESQ